MDDGRRVRRDLAKDIQLAIDWLDAELTRLEALLSARYEPNRTSEDTLDFTDAFSRYAPDEIEDGGC
jgi:hypothetical protein